jgi:hypothetical protein
MTTTKPFTLGSVSTGTLRPEDLLPAFASIMRQFLDANGHSAIYVERAETIVRNDFYDMELAEELVSTLMDGIQGYCPPFIYFGAHPGDGADFGFWPDWDALDEARRDGDGMTYANGEEYLVDANVIVQVSDHGNTTVMDLERHILWTTGNGTHWQ